MISRRALAHGYGRNDNRGLAPNATDFHSTGGGGELSGSAFLRSVFWNFVVFGRLG